ncbi:MAG: AAA family ATPase, partial [Deltaproteobacteria bacterium]|nr:AAA family ATPase [Deltaproteobacteria bacterium]
MKQPGAGALPAVRLDLENEWAWWGEQRLELMPKAFAVLRQLVTHAGRLVTKEELLTTVWGATVVSEAALTSCIRDVRKALGETAARYIETVPRRGFRFIGPVAAAPPVTSATGPGSSEASLRTKRDILLLPQGARKRTLATPVVGRETELEQLHQVLEQAFEGQRQLVFVTGEAGIGKTTVVEAFLARLSGEGGVWIGRGQCVEQHGAGEAYLPVLEALGRLGRGAGGERLIDIFKHYAPTWLLQLPALLSDSELEAVQRRAQGASRERMLREVCEALEALTTDTLLIVVLEDLHWSDHATLDLLTMLAQRREAARLLVVGTYRPAEVALREHPLAAVKQGLQQHGACTEVALEFLSDAAVGEYLRLRFPQPQFPEAFPRLLHRATDGNPLFLLNT